MELLKDGNPLKQKLVLYSYEVGKCHEENQIYGMPVSKVQPSSSGPIVTSDIEET